MQNLISTSSQEQTMSSLELLDVINAARGENDEPTLRRNVFHDRVADELDGEHYKKIVVTNPNGTQSQAFELDRDQCMLVSMRESKAVRRSVLAKLKAVESGQQLANTPATLALVECAANLLRASDSGKVVMLRKAGQAIGADTSFLPDYTEDSAPGHVGAMDTASLTQLLRDYEIPMGAAKFNQILREIGIIERRTRRTTSGEAKAFWCITDSGMEYGKNVVSPQSPRETQPHYYRDRFIDLLALAGLEAAS